MSKSEEFVNWWEWDNVKVEFVDEIRAERDALKKRVEELENTVQHYRYTNGKTLIENQRYKQVFEEIREIIEYDEYQNTLEQVLERVEKVLKGESECSYGN